MCFLLLQYEIWEFYTFWDTIYLLQYLLSHWYWWTSTGNIGNRLLLVTKAPINKFQGICKVFTNWTCDIAKILEILAKYWHKYHAISHSSIFGVWAKFVNKMILVTMNLVDLKDISEWNLRILTILVSKVTILLHMHTS